MNDLNNYLRVVRGKSGECRFAAQFVTAARTAALLLAILAPVAGRAATNTFLFTYINRAALLADGWSFTATTNTIVQNFTQYPYTNAAIFIPGPQNTEITDTNVGAVVAYHQTNGALGVVTRIPCDVGYIWGSPLSWTNGTWPRLTPDPQANLTRNTLFRNLPTNWVSARLSVSFAPSQNYHQLELMMYQDDDNYIEEEFTYNSFLQAFPFDLPGPTAITLDREFYTFPSRACWTYFPGTNVVMRLDRDPATADISAYWSPDGTNWTTVGRVSEALTNARLAIVVGGSGSTFPLSGLPNCDLSRVDIITSDTYTSPPPVLVVQPQHLVYNSVQGQACVVTQRVNVALRPGPTPVNWTVTSNATWLSASVASGQTPGFCDVAVNTTGLVPGIYQGALSFAATGPANSPASVNVSLIINTNGLVSISTWKDVRAGAMSVWVDDSNPTAFDELSTNGLAGTYVMWHEGAPGFYTTYYQAGMELGGHSVDHPAVLINEPALRFELATNILTLVTTAPVPQSQVISFAWPVGVTSPDEESIAADYFLACRGYNLNQLEQPSPDDFMNLKSYNSHEHFPFPPADFRPIVDAAIAQGMWFNMVLHAVNNDNGAIAYTVGKNIWVAPAGTVTKYILQRDRVVITNYVQTASFIQFNCYRLPLDPSSLRSFETAITTNDVLTFTVNGSASQVHSLTVNGVPISFTNNGGSFYFDTLVTTNAQTVLVNFQANTAPVLPAQTNRTVNALSTLTVTNTATDVDLPAQTLTYTFVATNVVGGSVQTNVLIDTNGVISWTPTLAQGAGSYVLTTVVTDNGIPPLSATNSFTVTVNDLNVAPVLPVQTNRVILGSNPLTITNTATENNPHVVSLTYQLSGPTGASIDTNGIIRWTPSVNQVPSSNVFTTVVTNYDPQAINAQSLGATNSFTVLVVTNGLVLPAQTNRTINELTTMLVTNTAADLNTNATIGGSTSTNTFNFSYTNRAALLADGWSFLAANTNGTSRNTEILDTNVGVVSYAQTNNPLGLVLRVPCDNGDLWQSANNTRNSLFRSLPTNWLSMRLVLSFAPSQNYQQVQLALYQDDDNYVEVGRAYNSFATGQSLEFTRETNQAPATLGLANVTATSLLLRLDQDLASGNVSGLYSADGTNWISMGQTSQTLTNTELAIWVGGLNPPNTYSNTPLSCDLSRVDVLTTNIFVPLTYTLAVTNTLNGSAVTNATIDTNGVISWTPTEAQGPGNYSFTTSVSDGTSTTVNTFQVTVNEVNVAPVLPAQTNRTLVGLQSLTMTNTASDSDIPVNPLGYVLVVTNKASGAVVGNATIDTNGVIRWTPTVNQVPSTNQFTTVVTDTNVNAVNAQNLTATNSFMVTVMAVHNGPVLPVQTNRTTIGLQSLVVTNTATDNDIPGPTFLSYQLISGPTNAVISTNGVITWSPTVSQVPSTNVFKTVVSDNGLVPQLSATNVFTNVVSAVHNGPVLPVQTNRTTIGLQSLVVTNAATDNDIPGPTFLSYQLISGPTNAVIDTNGVITWSPTVSQVPSTNVFKTVVSDNGLVPQLSATNVFTNVVSAVHNGPVLPVQTNRTTIGLQSLVVTNTASDNDIPGPTFLSYQLISGPTNAVIDTNGVISWSPTVSQVPSTNVFKTVVSDNGLVPQLSETNVFTNVVSAVHNGPVLPVQTNRTTIGLQSLVVTNTASDNDIPGPTFLSYQLISGPTNAVIDTNGVISWSPTVSQVPSTNVFKTVVSDNGLVPQLSATNVFTNVVSAVHNGPVLPVQTNRTTIGLQSLVVTNTASDNDIPGPTFLSYQLISGPTNAVIDTNGVISWSPTVSQVPSTNVFKTVVSDNGLVPQLSETNVFTNVVSAVHNGPVLPVQTNRTTIGLQSLVVTNTATDNDIPGPTFLSYQLISGPTNAVIDTNGVISWSPTVSQVPSTNVFETVVSDNGLVPQLSATNVFTNVVSAVHNGPVLPVQTNRTTIGLQSLVVTNTASDNDIPGPTFLSYQLISGPTNAVIDTNGVISWSPTVSQVPSTNVFETVVSDNGLVPQLSATNVFTNVVSAVHNGPVLPVQTNRTTIGLQSLVVTNTATDNDIPGPTFLSYQLISGPTNAVIDTNGVISWSPTVSQVPSTNVFETVVSDNGLVPQLSATNVFTNVVAAVHNGPVLPVQTNRTTIGLQSLVVTNTASDNDIPGPTFLSYQLISGPTNAVIDTNGVITWSPTVSQVPSTNVFKTVVSDNGLVPQLSETNVFTNVVSAVHNGPVLPVQTNRTTIGLQSLVVTNTATDNDIPGPTFLSYQLISGPTNAVIDTNGVISWSPTMSQVPSTNVFKTVVSDNGLVPQLSTTNVFTNVVAAVHNGPVLPVQTNRTTIGLQSLVVTNTATDNDIPGPTFLSYQLISGPTNAVIDTNGVISWSPTVSQVPSTNVFKTVVSDNGLVPQLSTTNVFTNVVAAVHNGPVLPVQTNRTTIGLQSLVVTNTATDNDIPGPTFLSYQLISGPTNAVIDTNGVISWSPTVSQVPSTNVFETVVSDNGLVPQLSATNVFTNVVSAVHNGPVLPVQTNRTTIGLQSLVVTNTATDNDIPGPTFLSYQLISGPTNAVIDTNGVISWSPTVSQVPSTNVFETVVSDNGLVPQLSATNVFTNVVSVLHNGPSLNDQTNRTINELTTLMVTNSAVDNDVPPLPLTYQLVNGSPTNAVIDTNGVITWTPTEAQGPTNMTITTVVSDGSLSATNGFQVTVNEVNVAPILPAQTNRTLIGLQSLVVTNTATDSDIPANPLGYTLVVSNTASGVIVTNATIDANGVIHWTPTANQVPSTNQFTTVVTDTNVFAVNAQNLTATNSFAVTVLAPVVANNDTYTADVSTPLNVAAPGVLSNDSGGNGNLTAAVVSGPTHGILNLNGNGSFTYTPTPDYLGTDSFVYRATDGQIGTGGQTNAATATVTITVTNVWITAIRVSNSVATITWNAVPGQGYRLQFKQNLDDTTWSNVVPDVIASGPTASMTNGVGNSSHRFYRIFVVP